MKNVLSLVLCVLSVSYVAHGQYSGYDLKLDTIFAETQLDEPKHIQVYVPDGFDKATGNQYPLYIIFDMQNSINFDVIVRNIDYLSAFGQIPTGVIVGIDALPQVGRYYETQLKENDENALGEANAEFVFESVIPLLQRDYKADQGTVLIGHSRYGYFTTHLLSLYPEDLIGVVSLSPFFEQKNTDHSERLADSIISSKLEHDLYYIVAVGDTIVDTGDYFRMMQSLERAELPDRFHYKGLEYPLGDHYTVPGMSIGTALYTIFEKWYETQLQYYRSSSDDLHALHDSLQEIVSNTYGAPLPFSLGVYNGVGWRYFGEENKPSAKASWELLGAHYPQFSYAWLFAAERAYELGEFEEYEALMQKAKDSVPNNTMLTQEELDEVLEEIDRITDLNK